MTRASLGAREGRRSTGRGARRTPKVQARSGQSRSTLPAVRPASARIATPEFHSYSGTHVAGLARRRTGETMARYSDLVDPEAKDVLVGRRPVEAADRPDDLAVKGPCASEGLPGNGRKGPLSGRFVALAASRELLLLPFMHAG